VRDISDFHIIQSKNVLDKFGLYNLKCLINESNFVLCRAMDISEYIIRNRYLQDFFVVHIVPIIYVVYDALKLL